MKRVVPCVHAGIEMSAADPVDEVYHSLQLDAHLTQRVLVQLLSNLYKIGVIIIITINNFYSLLFSLLTSECQ